MLVRILLVLALFSCCIVDLAPNSSDGCCAVYPQGKPVVNADQTVIILWDAATRTQHFIRQASFKSDADDFGFLVPSPTQPELEEAGNDAFPYLRKLTEPERKRAPRQVGISCGCSTALQRDAEMATLEVKVLEEKRVAGFDAAVLETTSATALTKWLKDNGYVYSPEVAEWAKPYLVAGWKITALKVAKDKSSVAKKDVSAAALRISFKTDRPIFPYREPDYKNVDGSLTAKRRLLRIYFLADARYDGELTKETPWTGKVAWAGKIQPADRAKVLDLLKLPATTGPANWWLTEFEDDWSYKLAPADVYFSRSAHQDPIRRAPIIRLCFRSVSDRCHGVHFHGGSDWPADLGQAAPSKGCLTGIDAAILFVGNKMGPQAS